jgi:hypothetical protein
MTVVEVLDLASKDAVELVVLLNEWTFRLKCHEQQAANAWERMDKGLRGAGSDFQLARNEAQQAQRQVDRIRKAIREMAKP